MRGCTIDSKTMNILILGGIVNILNQSEVIEEMEEKTKVLEYENVGMKARIEALENWVLKQDVRIVELGEKLPQFDHQEESGELKILKNKIQSLEIDVKGLRQVPSRKVENPASEELRVKKCNICGEKFGKNYQLEKHAVEVHNEKKQHHCNVCEKSFYLRWRLDKHKEVHEDAQVSKFCHFFNNDKVCPFDDVGCKFIHKLSGPCKFKVCTNQLCKFQHGENEADRIEDITDLSENEEEAEEIAENQCHLCMKMFPCNDTLFDHFEHDHNRFYLEILSRRVAENLS